MRADAIVIAVTAAVIGWGSQAAAQEADTQTLLGRITFQLSCAVCHGAEGRGEGGAADYLRVPAPDLTTLAKRNGGDFPAARVKRIIEGGAEVPTHGGQMPAWGLIFLRDFEENGGASAEDPAAVVERRIDALVGYLETIQTE